MYKHLPLDEKLLVLQEVDGFSKWSSLDDRRVCVLCERMISGRMIDVCQDKRGAFHLHCPTPGCPATARDWLYHGATTMFLARASKGWGRPPVSAQPRHHQCKQAGQPNERDFRPRAAGASAKERSPSCLVLAR